ncbi:MAG: Amuc_1098 family type IV pilus outer membrane protein [Verrucomicrobiota bacterium]
MHHVTRVTFSRGCVVVLALACVPVVVLAKEPPTPAALAQRELEKRRATIEEAQELLTQGDQAYQAGRFADAVTAFSGAFGVLPNSPLTAELRAAAAQRYAQASVEHARVLSRKGDVAAAKAAVDAVLNSDIAPQDPAASALRNQLDDPLRTNPALTKEHGADVDAVRRLLYTAEGAFNLGKYAEAKKHYEGVLRIDSTNSAARRGMEQIAATKSAYQKSATDQTRAAMLSDVDAAWELTVPAPILDVAAVDPEAAGQAGSFVPVANKLARLVIPHLILENATLLEAIDLLRLRAAELDDMELNPARRGINFHIDLGDETSEVGNKIRAFRFNMRLNHVPISQALQYINGQTQTSYTTDDFTVIIHGRSTDSKDLVSRSYRVPPDFLSVLSASSAASPSDADPFSVKPAKGLLTERRGVQEVLHEQGIQFPEGASASLNPATSTLFVINTVANQDIIDQIVKTSAATEPVMVCVRVTLIRVEETRLKELGFDWLLSPTGVGGAGWIPGTQNLNLAGGTRGNGGSLADMTLPPSQADRSPVTAGNRSGDSAIYQDSLDGLIRASDQVIPETNGNARRAPGIFQVSKIMSGSSVQALMRGLDQKKGVDVMTAASTVTRSGQASSVRMVREIPYPTEYEPPQLPQTSNANSIVIGGSSSTPMMVTPSHPTAYEKRDVGIVLDVTPTADTDKRFVDVALNPSVVDFDGFVNYGSPIYANSALLSANRILMPIFSTHRTATNLSVADGATIVIGGLLQNRIQNVADKTPGFGSLPIVGRLFQSQAKQGISTAVVFLVNIQLVDPTGQPYNKR